MIATVMGGYEGHQGWINYLAVKPSARHTGYAQAIMQAVELRLKAKEVPENQFTGAFRQ
ncbi:GNAT family N-acetyltransferase [Vibrio sp. PP-XX7]